MRPSSKKKGNAVLRVNVPAFKFEKARDYDKMYEEAFYEAGTNSYESQFKKNSKKLKPKESDEHKLPSLMKPQENKSGLKASKLKPIDDKLKNSRLNEKQKYINQLGGSNLQWINDIKRKQANKAERPARSPERLNQSMMRVKKLEVSPLQKKQSEQEPEMSDIIKTKEGASKNLKDYDCWENDLDGQEWIKKYENTPPPHGKAPIYHNGQYVWVDMQVINYDEKTGKFYIRILHNGLLKFVNRLSLQFKDQDHEKFQQRLNLTKERQKNADHSIKLLKYIESINDEAVSPLNKQTVENLKQKFSHSTSHAHLMEQIRNIHLNNEKKFLLYDPKNTMMIPEPSPKIQEFEKRTCPTYNRFDPFERIVNQITGTHISGRPKQLRCEKQILQKGTQIITKYGLFGNLIESESTMTLDNLKQKMEKEAKNSHENWEIIWRSHIVSEIQHILKEEYRFFVTEKNAYENDPLKRVIIKFDVLFNTVIREKMINQTISNYLNFMRSFMVPKQNQFYRIRSQPLIIINMNVNLSAAKKKKKKSRNQKRDEAQHEEEAEETVFYEPSLDMVEEALLMPFQELQKISCSFNKIEKQLIPLLNLESVPSYPLTSDNPVLSEPSDQIVGYIRQASKKPLQILSHFKAFSFLIQKSHSSIIKKLFPQKTSITFLQKEEIENKLHELWKAKCTVERLEIDEVNCGLFEVRTKVAKQTLIAKATDTINEILKKIHEICAQNSKTISHTYKERQEKLVPKETALMQEQELKQLKKLVSENETTMQKLKNEVDTIADYYLILEKYMFNLNDVFEEHFWSLRAGPSDIKQAVQQANRIISERQSKLSEKLQHEKELFNKKLIQLEKEMQNIKKENDYKKVSTIYSDVQKFKSEIQEYKKEVESFNEREEMFKQPTTTYQQLDYIESHSELYIKMWEVAIRFHTEQQRTYSGPLYKINYAQLQKSVNREFFKQTIDLTKQFDNIGNDDASEVLNQMKADIEKFRKNMWLIQLLVTEPLIRKPVYLKEISEVCGTEKLQHNDQFTLRKAIELGLDEHHDEIEEISKKADKQYSLEKKLNGIVEQLKKLEILTKTYPKAKTHILQNLDDAQQILDDNLNALLMMKSSPFIRPIIVKATAVEGKIVLIQDTLDNWLKTQRGWMYLQPIFASEDIQQKMPQQKQKFDKVDKHWKVTLEYFTKEKNMWENIEGQKYKSEFEESNRLLDEIQKSLSEYLETKRKFFPRFYFLSDEELLEILAQTKDPQTVQRHINKCFEGIGQLEMKNGIVSGMVSMEKQKVTYSKKVDVNQGEKKGNVQRWLSEIEGVMIDTLKRITKTALEDTSERVQWVRMWPAQTVLGVNMIRWTNRAEEAIMNNNIKDYLDILRSELKDIVKLVRTDLSELDRLTLGALVTIDVHGKDVIEELQKQKCQHPQDFSWIAQLRYYWDADNFPKNPLPVKMINAELFYAFEYLGNSPRLVITPLTDRCYRTLMGAFHLYYGGAPQGPAGTGKTETVKDLAKALSVFCVVFNCSDGLNYIAMRKFFKGLASSGSWCCFDQFNRIDLQVLSVIAQQVLTIQAAIRAQKRIFDFDGEENITLIPTCAINITMNPGYAGRSELPDNLKALFRPCAMMVPDYALIAEIYLYSVGFEEARGLAKKIVASLRLSSEQLSSQDHYDFGMRALKAILTAAGNLKRVMLDDDEDVVCLRALMDVNIPKFTVNDVPLFSSITSDLFPSTKLPKIDYGKLQESFIEYCQSKNLQPEEGFLAKCIQLYDTVNVRHGLMVVGAAFSGKSKVTEVLAEGMGSLAGFENFTKVQQIKLNPKSITSDQLYGKLDPNTKSWSDGVVAIIMRKCAEDAQKKERKWIVFDGPVDAIWIQNMNTVLDDNKKLCLTSGQIIKLTNWMTMMFEVEDLAVASPATVSRCGMVFLETKQLGWFALVKTFIANLPQKLEKYGQLLTKKIKYAINGVLAWTRKYGKFLVHESEMTFTNTYLKLLETYIRVYGEQQTKIPKQIEDILSNLTVFCTIWSIGVGLEQKTRRPFSQFFIHLINGSADIISDSKIDPDYQLDPIVYGAKLPEKCYVFDMFYNQDKLIWQNWSQTQPPFVLPKGNSYNDLIIPTNDSIRHNYFLHQNIKNHLHCLFVGPTGTGKSINVANQLANSYYNETYTFLTTAFSGQTNANQAQRLIDSKICTRRRKGYFGPEGGKAEIVIFIDDLNMPIKEKFGAQPPIQLLRQWMDNGGWYDLDTKQFKYLCGINFVAAMLPPVGGRNVVTMRYLRHYNLIYVEPFDNDSLSKIFGNILQWYFINLPLALPKAITNLKDNIISSTIQLYTKVQTSKQLLPTPSKSHYIYNLRDLSKVFQGMTKATPKSFTNENDFIKLWAHQCSRTFKDRLINIQDQQFFDGLLKDLIKVNFKRDWGSLVTVEPLLWASFIPTIVHETDKNKKLSGIYCELTDRQNVKTKCYDYLEQYNNMYTANRMNLVLFMVAIEHVIKIVRVITTTFGHALLVGVGGSGRKSLAQLGSFIAHSTEYSEVNSKNWIEQVQKVMKVAGLEQKETIFLFSDTQILKESMVEQVCNILNNGEIPNLFPLEQKAKIVDEITAIKPTGSFNEKFQYFVQLCRKNLHMVICMSPVGEDFRRRLRTFPSLVNCTTIDWFLAWPEQALISTADNHFKEAMGIEDQKLRSGLVQISVDMQMRVTKLRNRYQEQLRRYYYVTPTSYLELLGTLKRLLSERETMVTNQIKRYKDGCETIEKTEAQVAVMQKQLEELQPKLEKATIENKQLLVNLQANQKEADAKKKICQGEEKQCNIQRDEANTLRASCQADLDKVLPLLDQASAALDKISQDDMTQLKSYVKPPPAAAIVMEGVCYVFGQDSNIKFTPKQPGSMEKIQDFWGYSKKNLLNAKLISRVKEFREDKIKAIPQKNINKLRQFVTQPDFEKEKVFNASKAAGSLSLWIRAVVDTYGALLVVEPKKKQLAEAEERLSIAEKDLAEKKAALDEVLKLLQKLEDEYKNAKDKEQELKRNVHRCQVQLQRAQKLIKGLAGQKIAWGKKVIEWGQQKTTVLGDCVLCAGIIAYMGAFPITYRDDTLKEWQQLLKKLEIKSSGKFSLQSVLSDPLIIGIWTNQQQLPNDDFSIDNAIILKNSTRWPLMIDPQVQANNWVKIMEKQNKLITLKQNSPYKEVQMKLESALQVGIPVLLQNIGETVDAIYDFVLQKKLIKSGASYRIKFGDRELEYSHDFRFYMTTKLARPHYSPEICVKATLLNFQVTLEGLDDQMLNIIVKKEEPVKQEQKQRNIKQFFENKNKQKATEDLILKLLGSAEGNLLDDEQLINTLQNSKKQAQQISQKMEKLEYFRTQFNNIRNFYKEVSKRVSNLYFITLDLANIEPTYQWSLEFYINMFEKAIQKAIPGKENRCRNVIDKFQILFYESLSRSLLEKDKLIFSLLITIKILTAENKITSPEVRFMMVGGTWIETKQPIPQGLDWISNKIWCTLSELQSTLPGFQKLTEGFKNYKNQWTQIYKSQKPFEQKWPGQWNNLSLFKKLIITRIIRPDRYVIAVQSLISQEIGKQYIEPPPFNMQQTFLDSNCYTPLIFILSPGADPRLEITNLAESKGFKEKLSSLSLGQGQGQIAEKAIKSAMKEGTWVLLQNCHLAPSFMPDLQRILETDENYHEDFRIWLTSMPSNIFPVTILMKGIKMTYEPPRGLKNNLLRSFGTQNQASFVDCEKEKEWKKMFLGLSFFHALILQRRKFGPLGWNIPYEFTAADFAISQSQLKIFLNTYQLVPYEALNYMAAEANYGGRVTDPMDRRLIKIILKKFYSPEILSDDFKMTNDGVYRILDNPSFDESLDYIKNLPINDGTEVFGLHPNAEISSAIIETELVCQTILALLPRDVGGGGISTDDLIKGKVKQILAKLPELFDIGEASKKHPVKYQQSMNTVLQQELFRFNKLLKTVRSTLVNVDKAIDGFVVMSQDLEMVFNSIFDNKVPDAWKKAAYPSLKPLGSWVNDFVERLKFMQKWIDQGAPPNFWISGFFFTQSFLTGVLQNYARKYKKPIDTLLFEYSVIGKGPKNFDVSKTPEDGCYIHGLFLDGARWDEQQQCLNQSYNKVLYSKVPYIWLKPTDSKIQITEDKYYICPVYKTSERRGVLSTTGHSTNYVLSIDLVIEKSTNSDHWVRRGVAMLTQLND